MKFSISALLALSAASSSFAAPQGAWPEDMRGNALPAQDWVMVIPATRAADGSIIVWDRGQPWTRAWIVPKATPGGTRTVAINGDAEDMRIVSAQAIDNMSVASLSRLAGKYGAEAIAVAVEETDGAVAVAAWAKGSFATWDASPPPPDAGHDPAAVLSDARASALALIDGVYAGRGRGKEVKDDDGVDRARIVAQRFNASLGVMEYRVVGGAAALERIARAASVRVTSRSEDVPASIDLVVTDGRDVEDVLADVAASR
jgi:hypothetical protein